MVPAGTRSGALPVGAAVPAISIVSGVFSSLGIRRLYHPHESVELPCVETIVTANTVAYIDAKRAHESNRFGDILRIQPAGEPDRNRAALDDGARNFPVVHAAGAAQLAAVGAAAVEGVSARIARRSRRCW